MIKPMVGRIVWYWLGSHTPQREPLAAIIAAVKSDSIVNLAIFDAGGHHGGEENVPLIQDGDERPKGHYCEWMPYQKGQAAKTESLESVLSLAKAARAAGPEEKY